DPSDAAGGMKDKKAKGKRQKAKGKRAVLFSNCCHRAQGHAAATLKRAESKKSTFLLPLAFCLLPFAFLSFLSAQTFTQRGFLESKATFYPQDAPGDSSHAIGEWLLRYEPSWKLAPWLKFSGSFDARTDTHRQVERV